VRIRTHDNSIAGGAYRCKCPIGTSLVAHQMHQLTRVHGMATLRPLGLYASSLCLYGSPVVVLNATSHM